MSAARGYPESEGRASMEQVGQVTEGDDMDVDGIDVMMAGVKSRGVSCLRPMHFGTY